MVLGKQIVVQLVFLITLAHAGKVRRLLHYTEKNNYMTSLCDEQHLI